MTESFVPQNGRRIITLDLESISLDPNDPRGALGTGGKGIAPGEQMQIVVAGMLIDDGRELVAAPAIDRDETKLLRKLWGTLRADDTLVGCNIRGWDSVRLKQRSWILGVRPTVDLNLAKYRETNVVDVMELWTNWSPQITGVRLDDIARALGLPSKSGSGAQVEQLWREERYRELLDYCMQDVYLTYLIYCRMHYRDPLPFNLPKPAAAQQDYAAPLRESIAAAEQRRPEPVPVRLPLQDPPPAPRYVNEAPDGRYGYKSDGRGGLIPTMPERSSPVVGFGAAQASPDPAPARQAVAQTTQSGRSPRSRSKRVFYAVNGDRLVLNGGTYAIKDALKGLGARPTGEGQTFAWELPVDKFDTLAGLCARAGLALVPAAREAA